MPLIQPGDDLATHIMDGLSAASLSLINEDMVVIAHKIVSKAEGCFVNLTEITPSPQAEEVAALTGKPPAHVEAILQDSRAIIRACPNLLIVEHHLGFISANAGLDHSNVSPNPDVLLRLPRDPDASARRIRSRLADTLGIKPAVLIIDSHGRAWRWGTVGVVIGLSGVAPVQNLRGQPDLFGNRLQHTEVGFTDQIAAAASLVMGQTTERCPVVIVRGLSFEIDETARAADVLRPKERDLFR